MIVIHVYICYIFLLIDKYWYLRQAKNKNDKINVIYMIIGVHSKYDHCKNIKKKLTNLQFFIIIAV